MKCPLCENLRVSFIPLRDCQISWMKLIGVNTLGPTLMIDELIFAPVHTQTHTNSQSLTQIFYIQIDEPCLWKKKHETLEWDYLMSLPFKAALQILYSLMLDSDVGLGRPGLKKYFLFGINFPPEWQISLKCISLFFPQNHKISQEGASRLPGFSSSVTDVTTFHMVYTVFCMI